MSYSGSTSVVSRVFDAALSPESWPLALEAVAETVGASGAGYIVDQPVRAQRSTRGELRLPLRRDRWLALDIFTGPHALDQLAAGVIVTDARGRLIEMNRAAETILRRGDALSIREHRLCARRADEDTKLAQLIAAAAAREIGSAGAGRSLIGRGAGRMGYTLTVAPLRGDLTIDGRPLAIVIVTDPDAQSVSASDLADCFGLSPAESRLALALITGKKLADIAVVFGVQITTLRTQLSSSLRKAGVKRQIDLLRVLPTVTNLQET